MKLGLNHVPLKAFDIEGALYELGQLLDMIADCVYDVAQLCDRKKRLVRKPALDKARKKMSSYWIKHRHFTAEPIDQANMRREIEFVTRRHLVTATDKAANTPAFVCVNFIRELALKRLSSPDFILQHEELGLIMVAMHAENEHLTALPRVGASLPYLMAVFKAHKRSFRWITNTSNSAVSSMAKLCACLLAFLAPSVIDFCEEESNWMEDEYGVRPNLWWPTSSVGEFAASLPPNVTSVFSADITRCFELIPTDTSEHSLVAAVKFFVESAMKHRRDRSPRDSVKVTLAPRYDTLLSDIPIELLPGSAHHHVVTTSPNITDNCRHRAIMKLGLNHVPLKAFDIEGALYELGQLLDMIADCVYDVAQLCDRKKRLVRKPALDKARKKMSSYWIKHRHFTAEPIDQANMRREIEFVTRRHLVTATDKAANTPAFVCVNFIRELALKRLSSPDFILQHEELGLIMVAMHAENEHLTALPRVGASLPYLMAVFKAHKRSFRWITNTSNSAVSSMAKLCACLLAFLAPSVIDFCEEESNWMEDEYGVRPNLWWPTSSVGEFAASLPPNVTSVFSADITRCFELIPTDTSEHGLVAAVKFFVESAMKHRRDKSPRDSVKVTLSESVRMIPSWASRHLCLTDESMFFTEKEIVPVTEWCVSHSLVQLGGEVWRHLLGIPMGLACFPL
ncbi:hypothetical protein CBR_g34840 [Chara braunii]|uniref:Uncharacterized protein n=1 Tax=Chara braunii TaxID=69332 RepID=A0A388LJG0_CHABU|nr:hypothetical protein CBR_g34840 [Chara braunii]|eukprot:GBG82464.1 hypothetical protein CBR_g34840 [Chara braunii]